MIRVLTTIPGTPGFFWGDHTTLASDRCSEILYGRMSKGKQYMAACAVALRMLRIRRHFDAVVIEGGPIGHCFSWLQSILLFNKKPTLMIDCLWYRHHSRPLQLVKKVLKRLSAASVDLFAVWARHEITDYSREFGIPKHKFAYVPFHITIEGYTFSLRDEGYLFAGGNGDRDYKTLIEAVQGLDIPLFIAAGDPELFQGIAVPPNVVIQNLSPEAFRQKMAACRIAVVPMREGLLHSGGQQTLLNSMFMGKPTVVVGPKAADGYIKNGVNGFIVNYADTAQLRALLLSLYSDEQVRREVGIAAHASAAQCTTDHWVRTIFSLAEQLAKGGYSAVAEFHETDNA